MTCCVWKELKKSATLAIIASVGVKGMTKKRINSRQKGARAEREVRDLLKERGYDAHRGQQFSGGNESPDVKHNLNGLHIEVKHVQNLNLDKAMEQSRRDAKEGEIASVWHRKNGETWKVTIDAQDFLDLWAYKEREEI